MGGGQPSCEEVDAYIICLVRVLNITDEVSGEIQAGINQAVANYGNPMNCNVTVRHLVQSVTDGSAPPPPVITPEVRDKENAYNQCMSTYMSAAQRLNLLEDVSRICGPLKVFTKCVWRVFEVDPNGMTEQQKTLAQSMTNDQLAQVNVKCDFSVDTLLAEMAAEGGSGGGVACVHTSFSCMLVVALCLVVFFTRRY